MLRNLFSHQTLMTFHYLASSSKCIGAIRRLALLHSRNDSKVRCCCSSPSATSVREAQRMSASTAALYETMPPDAGSASGGKICGRREQFENKSDDVRVMMRFLGIISSRA